MIGSEFFITDFVMFFFGLGALLTGLLTFFLPGIAGNLPLQFGLWIAMSSISLLTLRRYFGKAFRGQIFDQNVEDHMIGKTARVSEPIAPGSPGRISFEGTTWKAISYDETFQKGDHVTIIQQEGIGYVVTQQLLPDDTPDTDIQDM
ncbi:membrane protein implicated in regulation of membrane protease activity [Spirochaeta africana DSM 8902]|uniref:Membrane protein implicated in regulation of membrane protease activity n=2 Tax=Spirochaeta TaxID=146 RepID=H9UMV1_SPIAZ|nr:membrane protein implicated in regulation of membrane protease activity [Spirochaeta africana DSM 8902]